MRFAQLSCLAFAFAELLATQIASAQPAPEPPPAAEPAPPPQPAPPAAAAPAPAPAPALEPAPAPAPAAEPAPAARPAPTPLKLESANNSLKLGLLLQGNLQCFSDPIGSPTRRTVERFLLEGRYFLLGSDLHNLASLPMRLDGLKRAIDLVGEETVDRLTMDNPRQLLPSSHAGT